MMADWTNASVAAGIAVGRGDGIGGGGSIVRGRSVLAFKSIILLLDRCGSSTNHQDPLSTSFVTKSPILLHRPVHNDSMTILASFSSPDHHATGRDTRSFTTSNKRPNHRGVEMEEFLHGECASYTSDFLALPMARASLGTFERHATSTHARVVLDAQGTVRVSFGVVDASECLVTVCAEMWARRSGCRVGVLYDQRVRRLSAFLRLTALGGLLVA